jgi:formamidopyrimidine-DNA glycosylase
VGNIYASEALFRAGLSPLLKAQRLSIGQVERLRGSVREVLAEAIQFGSTVPLDWEGIGRRDGLFYYGQTDGPRASYEERLQVYDRQGQSCRRCETPIKRIVQSARSTFYCPRCQKA